MIDLCCTAARTKTRFCRSGDKTLYRLHTRHDSSQVLHRVVPWCRWHRRIEDGLKPIQGPARYSGPIKEKRELMNHLVGERDSSDNSVTLLCQRVPYTVFFGIVSVVRTLVPFASRALIAPLWLRCLKRRLIVPSVSPLLSL